MVFLNIKDYDNEKIIKLKKYYNSNAKIFMLIYMNGCGPCNEIKPEWAKLENVLSDDYKNDDKVIIIDIEKDILEKVNLNDFEEPIGFPTIVYLYNKKREDYENSMVLDDNEKDRKIDSLSKWIKKTLNKSNKDENIIDYNDKKDDKKDDKNDKNYNINYKNIYKGGKKTTKKHNKKYNNVHNKTKKQTGGKWSRKYKRSINCKNPKGFSQRQYCKYGRKNKK